MRGNNTALRRWWNDESCLVTAVRINNRLTVGLLTWFCLNSATIQTHATVCSLVVSGEWHRRDWLCSMHLSWSITIFVQKAEKIKSAFQYGVSACIRQTVPDTRGHDSLVEDIPRSFSNDWRGDKSRVEELRYLRYLYDVTASRLAYTLLPRLEYINTAGRAGFSRAGSCLDSDSSYTAVTAPRDSRESRHFLTSYSSCFLCFWWEGISVQDHAKFKYDMTMAVRTERILSCDCSLTTTYST